MVLKDFFVSTAEIYISKYFYRSSSHGVREPQHRGEPACQVRCLSKNMRVSRKLWGQRFIGSRCNSSDSMRSTCQNHGNFDKPPAFFTDMIRILSARGTRLLSRQTVCSSMGTTANHRLSWQYNNVAVMRTHILPKNVPFLSLTETLYWYMCFLWKTALVKLQAGDNDGRAVVFLRF
jgi:hypothetical protein